VLVMATRASGIEEVGSRQSKKQTFIAPFPLEIPDSCRNNTVLRSTFCSLHSGSSPCENVLLSKPRGVELLLCSRDCTESFDWCLALAWRPGTGTPFVSLGRLIVVIIEIRSTVKLLAHYLRGQLARFVGIALSVDSFRGQGAPCSGPSQLAANGHLR
jgi:hypothetical protein